MKREKVKCPKCGALISKSNISKHMDSKQCKTNQKNKSNIDYDKLITKIDENTFQCKICGKTYSKNGIKTHIWRMHTEEGKNFNPNEGYKTGKRVAWNKGLTKETNEIILLHSKKLKEKYKKGELIPSFLGKKHTYETKQKISQKRKEYLLKNPEKIPYILNHHSKGESYPEKYFKRILNKYKINFEQEKRMGLYSLDFYIPDKKIDLEIDGDQHYLDPKIINSDINRTNFLEKNGIKTIRIRWSEYQKLTKNERKEYINNLIKKLK